MFRLLMVLLLSNGLHCLLTTDLPVSSAGHLRFALPSPSWADSFCWCLMGSRLQSAGSSHWPRLSGTALPMHDNSADTVSSLPGLASMHPMPRAHLAAPCDTWLCYCFVGKGLWCQLD